MPPRQKQKRLRLHGTRVLICEFLNCRFCEKLTAILSKSNDPTSILSIELRNDSVARVANLVHLNSMPRVYSTSIGSAQLSIQDLEDLGLVSSGGGIPATYHPCVALTFAFRYFPRLVRDGWENRSLGDLYHKRSSTSTSTSCRKTWNQYSRQHSCGVASWFCTSTTPVWTQ